VEIICEGDELNEGNPCDIAQAYIEKHAWHVLPFLYQSGSAYLRATARRERQNYIVNEPDMEAGLRPATDSQILEVAQAVATRESEVGQSAISCASQWNDWPMCFCLSSIAFSSIGGSRVVADFFHTGLFSLIFTRHMRTCAENTCLPSHKTRV